MSEIQRQVPTATGVERRTLVAAACSAGLGGLFGVYLGGLAGPALAATTGTAGMLAVAFAARGAARRNAERLQVFGDGLIEEVELHRREETRLRAVARSMAAENEESERRRRAAESGERTKTAFIKSLGEELKTPLANVQGMSGLLLSTELNETQCDYARTIHGAADAVLAIVDDVLALSYINAGALEIERREFELTYCVESVVETCAARIKPKADAPLVECRLDPALPPWVVGDRGRLRQILLSVLERAVERSPEGRVSLSAKVAEQDASELVLRFEVVDSGEPLDAYARERMFEEFPTHEGGTGMLGLAVARQLARLMGGDMGVEDRAARGGGPARIAGGRERGTVIWMTARCGVSKREVAGARQDEHVDLAGLRVLLVDSDGESRSSLHKAGDALGLQLDTAATAAEALQLLKDSAAAGKTYAVGLIDADLSDIGGRDFGELLQSVPEAASMGLILLRPVGAFDRPTDLARHGFDAWVSKPISEARLRTALLHVTAEPIEDKGGRPESPEPRPQPRQLGARVLLVEDNIVNQKVARLLLSQIGCKVEVAMSGMDAIEKAMALDVDLILMDCLMPELDGYDATRAIRMLSDPLKSRVPIVGMTTGSRPSNRDTCIAAGMDDHVTKPVRLEELMRVVRHWSARPSLSTTEKAMYDHDEKSLDPGVIASLRDLGGDDPSIFNELVELFLSDTPGRIQALEQALASSSATELESAAHALKSSAGNLGAYVLSTLCKELEVCGRNKNLESAKSLVARSREEFKKVEEELREELA